MSKRIILSCAAISAVLAPAPYAAAADLVGHPAPPLVALCGPPPAAVAPTPVVKGFRAWLTHGYDPTIVDVQRYDPHHPPPSVPPVYVTPQTAYLATPLCDFPNGFSDRSWYDGQLFYEAGGVHPSPDTFMVIERK